MERVTTIKLASWIAIVGNLALAVLKVGAGVFAGSTAVLADGLDSLSDVVISAVTLAASVIIARPPDREHPYGHHRAETVATLVLAFVIFFMGGQLFIFTIDRFINHENFIIPGRAAMIVTVISICGKALLAWSQFSFGKKSKSAMLAANGHNMLNDVIMSAGVLAGLGAVYWLSMPSLDKIIGIAISIWIMAGAVRILRGLVVELMEGHEEKGPYRAIFQAVSEVSGAVNPHRVRIRRAGAMYIIDLDVEVDGSMTVRDAHTIAGRIEHGIKARLDNVFDIVIHIEPIGNYEQDEKFGLKGADVDGETR